MNKSKMNVFAAGMAIFAMFFGAGNIIFPLALGQYALDKMPYALMGLLITSVAMPFAGLIAMFLYKGQIHAFFGRLGKIPGFIIACFTISLLGPLGCAPRCIALAFSTFSMSVPGTSMILFSSISCLIIFLFVFNKGSLLKLIGYVLSPFKILLLVLIVIIGLVNTPEIAAPLSMHGDATLFFHGLKEGYNTMDLIGSFFFAPIIIASLANSEENSDKPGLDKFILKACGIGAFLLASIYLGFCYLASIYAAELHGIPNDRLLGEIAIRILGPQGGLIVSLTVAVACLTTAIALIAAFSNFIQKEVFADRVGYTPIVIASLLVTFIITTFEFSGIATFLGPVLELCYPILIVLTFYNLIHALIISRKSDRLSPQLAPTALESLE